LKQYFPNAERELALLSGKSLSEFMGDRVGKFHRSPEICISHLKPGESELTMREIGECVRFFAPGMLVNGQISNF